jgi:hypothetical protein
MSTNENKNKRWDDDTEFFLLNALEVGIKFGYNKSHISELLSDFLGRTPASLSTKLSELSQPVGYCRKPRKKPELYIDTPNEKSEELIVTVFKIVNFGAFCRTENNLEGLLHISQIADTYIETITDYLEIGDKIRVSMKQDHKGRYSFSARSFTQITKKDPVRLQLVK